MPTGRILRPRTQEGFDLLVPGRKPVDYVKINPHNPLAIGLYGYWIAQADGYVNVLTETKAVIGSSFEFSGRWGGQSGFLQDLNGTDSVTPASAIISSESRNHTYANGVTVTTVINADNPLTFGHLWFSGIFNNGGHGLLFRTNGEVMYRRFNSGRNDVQTAGANILRGQTYVISTAAVQGGPAYIYVNGVLLATGSDYTIAPYSGAYALVGRDVTTTEAFSGSAYATIIHDRTLSHRELVDIGRNPYQLLKPANSTPFLYSTGTPSTVTLSNLTFSARTATSITPRLDVTVS